MLEDFRGNIKFIHHFESHAGRVYWPGGKSGVTFDPGMDIGHGDWNLFKEHYFPLLDELQRKEAERARKVTGERARVYLDSATNLKRFRMSRKKAEDLLPILLEPYWNQITDRFPVLLSATVPGSVQTVLLSLAYNRGPGNRHLQVLRGPLYNGDWKVVGEMVMNMQQDHPLKGIRRRRQEEGRYILDQIHTLEKAEEIGKAPLKPLKIVGSKIAKRFTWFGL